MTGGIPALTGRRDKQKTPPCRTALRWLKREFKTPSARRLFWPWPRPFCV
jgi:hypothetical protein